MDGDESNDDNNSARTSMSTSTRDAHTRTRRCTANGSASSMGSTGEAQGPKDFGGLPRIRRGKFLREHEVVAREYFRIFVPSDTKFGNSEESQILTD